VTAPPIPICIGVAFNVLTVLKSEERSLHFAGRLLRRSEAEKQMRRPAPVGMTGIAGDGKETGRDGIASGGKKKAKVLGDYSVVLRSG